MDFEFSIVLEAIPALIEGAKLTCLNTIIGLEGGLSLGILAGLARSAPSMGLESENFGLRAAMAQVASKIAAIFVEAIRGTPIIVQAMFIYFAFPLIVRSWLGIQDFRLDALTAAIVTIIINAGAYIAEIVRGAVLSIHRGLVEAGLSLGISKFSLYKDIIGPLAFRRMIPPLGNQFIISLKDTSLFIIIGVGELTRQGQEIMASNFRALEIWSTVAIIYLIMTSIMAFPLRRFEKRLKIL